MGLHSAYESVRANGGLTEEALAEFCERCEGALPGIGLERTALVSGLGALTPAQEASVVDADSERCVEFAIALGCGLGNPKALSLMEERYIVRLPRALSHMKLSDDQMDEVLQEVRRKLLVGASPKIAEYAGKGSLSGLLKVTATRTAISLIRKEQRYTLGKEPLVDAPDSVDEEAMFLKAKYRGAFKVAFESAVAGLSSHERNLLRLHFLGRVTLPQLAKMYGVHRATIVRRLKQIRDAIEASTKSGLEQGLGIKGSELQSVMDLIQSRLDASVERVLQTQEKTAQETEKQSPPPPER